MEHGALEIAYHSEGVKADYLNAEHHAYRYSGADQNVHNHAAALVGWDDNFSRMNFNENYRPEINGAWLVRNNWGENFMDGGYFWMSYEQSFSDGLAQIVEEAPYHAGAVPSLSGTATFPYAGYHTVRLPELLRVDGYSERVNVHDGESWFSADGLEWWDGAESMTYIGGNMTTLFLLRITSSLRFWEYPSRLTPKPLTRPA